MKELFALIILFCAFIFSSPAVAGSGYYLGLDLIKNKIKTSTQTSTTISSSSIQEVATVSKNINSNDYALRFGYKHKISEHLFIAPEFFYNKINHTNYLYSTTMKAGLEVQDFSVFGALGYTENNYFNGSSENYGGGLEYKINDNFSLTAEYIKFGNITTNQTSNSSASSTNTRKNSQLETFKFGITYYFHE